MAKKKAPHPRGCVCKKCQPSRYKKHPKGCLCPRCRRLARWKLRRRRRHAFPLYPRRGYPPLDPEDANKVQPDIFDKVYQYFEVGTYEAVARECRKLVQSCDLCRGTGIEKKVIAVADPAPVDDITPLDGKDAVEPRLCPRCTDAREALNVLEGLRKGAAEVRDKAVVKPKP